VEGPASTLPAEAGVPTVNKLKVPFAHSQSWELIVISPGSREKKGANIFIENSCELEVHLMFTIAQCGI
jgi:hypothetical protein